MDLDKHDWTYFDDYLKAQRDYHEKKPTSTFEEKLYVCKPLMRETFKNIVNLTQANCFFCTKRILDVREGEEVSRVTIRLTDHPKVSTLKFWCNFRKWKNLLI